MVDVPLTLLLLVMAYLVGSLPMGVIVARVSGGTDPRTVGSGRTGGTNMLRAGGWGRAIAVAVLDLSKGALPILVARALDMPVEVQAITGLAAVLGSWKSIFLGFHGGRGVATGVGGMLAIAPWVVLLTLPAFIVIIWTTRYVSLGSILGTAVGAGIVILAIIAGLARSRLDPLRHPRRDHRLGRPSRQHRPTASRYRAQFSPGDRQATAPPKPLTPQRAGQDGKVPTSSPITTMGADARAPSMPGTSALTRLTARTATTSGDEQNDASVARRPRALRSADGLAAIRLQRDADGRHQHAAGQDLADPAAQAVAWADGR